MAAGGAPPASGGNLSQQAGRDWRRAERRAGRFVAFVLARIDEADDTAAAARVADLRRAQPDWSAGQLVEYLILRKCRSAAAVGAATAGSGLIPGIGTLAALTVGTAADVGATLKLQTELVLEIAAVHGRTLSPDEKRRVVALLTGLTLGGNRLLARGGGRLAVGLTERYAARWLAHALPYAGVVASAAVDVLSTYLAGRRAHAYFSRGPQAVGSWRASLRALSGVDERRLASALQHALAAAPRAALSRAPRRLLPWRRACDRASPLEAAADAGDRDSAAPS